MWKVVYKESEKKKERNIKKKTRGKKSVSFNLITLPYLNSSCIFEIVWEISIPFGIPDWWHCVYRTACSNAHRLFIILKSVFTRRAFIRVLHSNKWNLTISRRNWYAHAAWRMHEASNHRKQNYTIPNVLPLIRVTLLARARVRACNAATLLY